MVKQIKTLWHCTKLGYRRIWSKQSMVLIRLAHQQLQILLLSMHFAYSIKWWIGRTCKKWQLTQRHGYGKSRMGWLIKIDKLEQIMKDQIWYWIYILWLLVFWLFSQDLFTLIHTVNRPWSWSWLLPVWNNLKNFFDLNYIK